MLKKLLKYDLEWCYKPLIVFYILAIFFSIITRIVESLNQSLIVLIIDKICSGIVIAMFFSIFINNFMRIWARTIRNIYKDESYLTHTLPVSRNTVYLSKILTAIITLLTSFFIVIICLTICCLKKENWDYLKSTLENSATYLNTSLINLLLAFGLTVFFESLFMQIVGIIGIIIGYKSNNHKIIKSIIVSFIIYMILSLLSLGIIYIIGLFNPIIMDLFSNTEVDPRAIKITLFSGAIIYVAYNCIIYFIGKHILNKGVNVD